MFERYTEKARRVIFFARFESCQFGSPYIETEHLLLGILREDRALAMRLLRSDVKIDSIRQQIEQNTEIGKKVSTSVDLPLSNESKRVLAYAWEEAERLSHKHIRTEHLLLGVLREENSFGAALLRERGLHVSAVREELRQVRESAAGQEAGSSDSWLGAYASSMQEYEQRPLIGRNKELMRLVQVLGRSTKKCAVLVGEPGVGKRSIVIGLARAMAKSEAPQFLDNKSLIALDIAGPLAGSGSRQEAVTKHLPRELAADPNAIFFMEELFELLLRPVSPGGLDPAEILKPLFLSGKLQCISTATPKEYDQAMKRYRWLARCFSKIEVRPATEAETIEVLRSMKAHLEDFHSVVYEEGVIEHVVRSADIHVKDLHLPEKAVDLMDEAAAYVKAQQPGIPAEIKEMHKKIRLIVHRVENSVANHEFEKARFYSDEERKERENLHALEEKYQIKAGALRAVTPKAVEEALALWLGVPVDTIRMPGSRQAPS